MSGSVLWLTVFGLLFILYGLIVRMAGSGTMFFSVWLVMGFGMIAYALLIRGHFMECIPKSISVFVKGAAILWLLSLCICEALIFRGFYNSNPKGLEYLIILGAQVREDGPSKVLTFRLDKAAEYLLKNPETLCIVTGGQGYNEPITEAEAMKLYLSDKGIGKERIITEEKAVNTVQNIRFSKEKLPSADVPVGIVTNNFHIFRSMAIALNEGLTNVYGIPAPSDPIFLVNNMFREYFGIVKDVLAGHIRIKMESF